MPLLLESVKILRGVPCNLGYHQDRVRRSSGLLFHSKGIDLKEILDQQEFPRDAVLKCRLVFDQNLHEIECTPYQQRPINTAVLVESGDFSYAHKYLDRNFFDEIRGQYPGYDEMILHHNGLITDSSFSNLAFFDGQRWFTPASPLLNGTRRQQLLDTGKIHPANIRVDDLANYSRLSFINALLDLDESVIPVSHITDK